MDICERCIMTNGPIANIPFPIPEQSSYKEQKCCITSWPDLEGSCIPDHIQLGKVSLTIVAYLVPSIITPFWNENEIVLLAELWIGYAIKISAIIPGDIWRELTLHPSFPENQLSYNWVTKHQNGPQANTGALLQIRRGTMSPRARMGESIVLFQVSSSHSSAPVPVP